MSTEYCSGEILAKPNFFGVYDDKNGAGTSCTVPACDVKNVFVHADMRTKGDVSVRGRKRNNKKAGKLEKMCLQSLSIKTTANMRMIFLKRSRQLLYCADLYRRQEPFHGFFVETCFQFGRNDHPCVYVGMAPSFRARQIRQNLRQDLDNILLC